MPKVHPLLADPDRLRKAHHDDGLTLRAIGETAGVTESRVSQVMKKHGIPNRRDVRPRWLDDPAEVRSRLLAAGSVKRAAADGGVSNDRLRSAMAAHGITNDSVEPEELRDHGLLRRMYHDERMSTHAIAERLGVGRGRLRSALRDAGVQLRQPGVQDNRFVSDREWLTAAVEAGLSDSDIAEKAGVAATTVLKWRSVHGLLRAPTPAVMPAEVNDPDWLRARRTDDGMSNRQIADLLGVSIVTVQRRVRCFGVPSPTALSDVELRRMYDVDGMTVEAIAAAVGRAESTVRRRLHVAGVVMRSRGRHPLLTDRAALLAAVQSGKTDSQIAADVGVRPSTVAKWRGKHGIRSPRARVSAAAQELNDPVLLRRLFVDERWSIDRIAAASGVSRSTVTRALRRHRISASQRQPR